MRGNRYEGPEMQLSNEELVIYFGTYLQPKNLSQVAEDLYSEEKKDSVRSSFSRKKALEKLMQKNLIDAEKNGDWRYKANGEKMEEILFSLMKNSGEEFNRIELTEKDVRTIREMFDLKEVRRYFENDKLSNILGDKLSEAKKQLSTYIKMIYITLAGSRVLIEDLNIADAENIRISKESEEQMRQLVSLVNFMAQNSTIRVGAIFNEIMEGAVCINLMSIPKTESQQIIKLSEKAKLFIESTSIDIENMVEVADSGPSGPIAG